MSKNAAILVVDDDPALLRATSAVLASAGHTVHEARSAAEALEKVKTCSPDLVLVDVVLPDMSGLEVSRRIKADSSLTDIIVVLMSCLRTDSTSQAEGLEGGADDYIARPVSNRELVARVHGFLRTKRAEAALRASLERSQQQQAVVAAVATSPHLAAGDVPELALQLTELAAKALGVERVGVWLCDDDGNELRCVDLYEDSAGRHSAGAVLQRHEYQNEFDALSAAKYVDADDPLTDPRTAGYVAGYLKPLRITSMLDAVIRSAGRILGTLCFEHVERTHRWEPDEIAFACQLADQVALAIMNQARRKAEEALRESEERNRSIVAALPDLLFRISADGRFIDCRANSPELLLLPPHQVIGRRIAEILPPDLAHLTEKRVREALDSGQLQVYEYSLTLEGHAHWFEARMTTSGANSVLALIRDITTRKLAERALRESAQKWNTTFDAIGDCMALMDTEQNILQCNRAFAEYLERPLSEIIGRKCYSLVHTDGRPAEGCPFDRTLHSKRRETMEMQVNGRSFEVLVDPILSEDGEITGIVHILAETTERTQVMDALRRSEERYRTLVEGMAEGLIAGDNDDRIQYVNARFCQMIGRDPEELIGKVGYEVFAPEDERESIRAKTRLRQRGVSDTYETRMTTEDGREIWVSICGSPVYGPDGAVVGSIGLVTDVTQRRLAEEELRESEGRFRAAFEGLHDAVTIVTEDGKFLDCNQRALEMFRVESKARFIARRPADFSPPFQPDGRESVTASRERLREVLEKDGFVRFEWLHQRADGEAFPAEVVLTTYQRGGRSIIQGVIRDITARRRAEEEREKLQGQLLHAQKMEAVGLLAGGVAHDFNNMIQVILGHTDMALGQVASVDPLLADLEEIRTAAQRSAALTRQLLAFARKQIVTPKVLDLNATVEGTLKMLRRLIGEDIALSWKPGAGLWSVKMDPSQVDQVLANLCVNARDAIRGVGEVAIETKNVTVDEACCADRAGFVPGSYVQLSVSDDGCGMDKETLGRVFEPFFTTKGVGEGTGLGLSTVYGIVKQNEGFIDAYSEPGAGTVITIYLPSQGEGVQEEEQEKGSGVRRGGGETVLLVEDDGAILRMGARMLEGLGYRVVTAGTPWDAIRQAERAGEIDLLITDVVMPEMNGRELARRIGGMKPGLRCLYMSGYTADVIAHRGVVDAGVRFLQKPFTLEELARKVREALVG
ncbi:PAS domain S-box protein [Candidatus Fermentibacteria bacterium]|nr:PAS domain S-box protein [Candidatus Fermentibacteria bacterium]